VARLNPSLRERLDRIIERELPVVIGDANGADKAMQQYLHSRGYRNVEVFCSDAHCRNNVGEWTVRSIADATRERVFRFYSAKDQEMAEAATVGFMTMIASAASILRRCIKASS
jgi:adenine-specific DNA-methyltransferase